MPGNQRRYTQSKYPRMIDRWEEETPTGQRVSRKFGNKGKTQRSKDNG